MTMDMISIIRDLYKHLSIFDILHLMNEYGVNSKNVEFIPDFSIITKDCLVQKIEQENLNIKITLSISKVKKFYHIQNAYHQADINSQKKLKQIITKGTSKLLHDYFYGQFSVMGHWNNSNQTSAYYKRSIVYCISNYANYIQNKLSDFYTSIEINTVKHSENKDDCILEHNSILGMSRLKGSVKHFKVEMKICIHKINISEIDKFNIVNIITENVYYNRIKGSLNIKVLLRKTENEVENELPTLLGKLRLKHQYKITI
ncbi:type VI secretion system baseplate protein IglJ [Dongshaea marina]|uniref:type VI secretion system baseplate protein IglJ n=1 Tax=Dongshaea marina TaxID=2047966 RepID=UPI000D3EAAFE|nr:type VI secretion system baseplate protein IglJ [Dongshaea marina]